MLGTAAERQGEMGEIPADTDAFVISFPCGAGRARMLIIERHVLVDEVADCLDPRPPFHMPEHRPRNLGQAIRLAIAASQQEQQSLVREILDRVLHGIREYRFRHSGIPHQGIGGQPNMAGGRDKARAPVSERIPVSTLRHRRFGS